MHLSDYMAEKDLSDDDVATAIGRSRATVSRLRRSKIRPDWSTMDAVKNFTDGRVMPGDFDKIDENGDETEAA